ncbi:MAG: RloB family protein [Alphaproteobacteria bacterium]|jgi:hypothetical protein|nr:RloB family protein [Alphaproteobacteria bacterium]|tara:strand:- start:35 stop:562 length:528 start_codon:yes stop_codon:yes gene_type:complete
MARGRGPRPDRRDLRRRGPNRPTNSIFLLVCEGRKTEPAYFQDFARDQGQPGVTIRPQGLGRDPVRLARAAIRLKEENARAVNRSGEPLYDEIWCVFDDDGRKKSQLGEARSLASAQGIKTAVSNPCFEIWLLLHFQDCTGSMTAKRIERTLRKYISGTTNWRPMTSCAATTRRR